MKNQNELTISEANSRTLVDNHKFQAGDYVYMNNYGEAYYATESQWRDRDPADVGFMGEYPAGCFYNNGNEWFTEFEIVVDENA